MTDLTKLSAEELEEVFNRRSEERKRLGPGYAQACLAFFDVAHECKRRLIERGDLEPINVRCDGDVQ